MQEGKTALEYAVEQDYYKIVDCLVKQMDISQFDEVCNNDTAYCACIVIVGVTVGGAL